MSGRNNLWLVPLKVLADALTVSDSAKHRARVVARRKWIAYMSDYDGDEQWDIFFVSPKNRTGRERHQHP